MHEIAVREFGGPQGLRDPGALESALLETAAWVLQRSPGGSRGANGESCDEPSVCGRDKRTAFYATDAFSDEMAISLTVTIKRLSSSSCSYPRRIRSDSGSCTSGWKDTSHPCSK